MSSQTKLYCYIAALASIVAFFSFFLVNRLIAVVIVASMIFVIGAMCVAASIDARTTRKTIRDAFSPSRRAYR